MSHQNLDQFLRSKGADLPSPIAVILAEDDVELAGTIKHHTDMGFGTILVIGDVAEVSAEGVHLFPAQLNRLEDSIDALNKIINATIPEAVPPVTPPAPSAGPRPYGGASPSCPSGSSMAANTSPAR